MQMYVYRLRYRGLRQDRAAMAREGTLGELRIEREREGDRPMSIAYLLVPGTQEEALPRVVVESMRIRETLRLDGIEQYPKGRKKVEEFRQTWVCSPTKIPAERWPALPPVSTEVFKGFRPENDDDPDELPSAARVP